MRQSLAVLAACVAVVAATAAPARPASSPASTGATAALFAPQRQVVMYGHIVKLTRSGRRYVLRFDPAWWLGGVTAGRAAFEDTGSRDVPNDYYIVDEGHRLLTYLVPAGARATVITNPGTAGLRSTRVSVAELAQIVKGRNPKRRALYDTGNHLGFWIRVDLDTVRSLDQQYQP
jgi:hypothetical protein